MIDRHIIETSLRVRFAETDQMGIVHHAAHIVWLEEGRSQWLRTHGRSYTDFEKAGFSLAVSEINLRFRQPALYDRLVTVRCWVEEVRSRQTTFGYETLDTESGAILVVGYTKHICVDRQGRAATIPLEWQNFLRQP